MNPGRVQRRAFSDHLLGLDARLAQPKKESLDLLTIYLCVDQLVTYQPITLWMSRVNG
jgi:hypothetical protein